MSNPLDDPSSQAPHPRRSLSKWILLLIVWSIGIVMWVLYLILAAVILLRIL
jgi:hypothetical protein